MLFTPHLLFGAAVVSLPIFLPAGFLLAFLSHYFLDAVPHWDYSTNNIKKRFWRKTPRDFFYILTDFTLGCTFLILLASQKLFAFVGGMTAVIPDILTLCAILLPAFTPLQSHWKAHDSIHWFRGKKIPMFWKIFSQIFAPEPVNAVVSLPM